MSGPNLREKWFGQCWDCRGADVPLWRAYADTGDQGFYCEGCWRRVNPDIEFPTQKSSPKAPPVASSRVQPTAAKPTAPQHASTAAAASRSLPQQQPAPTTQQQQHRDPTIPVRPAKSQHAASPVGSPPTSPPVATAAPAVAGDITDDFNAFAREFFDYAAAGVNLTIRKSDLHTWMKRFVAFQERAFRDSCYETLMHFGAMTESRDTHDVWCHIVPAAPLAVGSGQQQQQAQGAAGTSNRRNVVDPLVHLPEIRRRLDEHIASCGDAMLRKSNVHSLMIAVHEDLRDRDNRDICYDALLDDDTIEESRDYNDVWCLIYESSEPEPVPPPPPVKKQPSKQQASGSQQVSAKSGTGGQQQHQQASAQGASAKKSTTGASGAKAAAPVQAPVAAATADDDDDDGFEESAEQRRARNLVRDMFEKFVRKGILEVRKADLMTRIREIHRMFEDGSFRRAIYNNALREGWFTEEESSNDFICRLSQDPFTVRSPAQFWARRTAEDDAAAAAARRKAASAPAPKKPIVVVARAAAATSGGSGIAASSTKKSSADDKPMSFLNALKANSGNNNAVVKKPVVVRPPAPKKKLSELVGRFQQRVVSSDRGARPPHARVSYARHMPYYPLPSVLVGLAAESPQDRYYHRQRHHVVEAVLTEYLQETELPPGAPVVPGKRWHALLFAEEVQVQHALAFYGSNDAILYWDSHRNSVMYAVEGLAEKRPSVLRGDSVHIQPNYMHPVDNEWSEGFVHVVSMGTVNLSFNQNVTTLVRSFPAGGWNLMFVASRTTQRAMHRAIDAAPEYNPAVLAAATSCMPRLKYQAGAASYHPVTLNAIQKKFIDSVVVRPTAGVAAAGAPAAGAGASAPRVPAHSRLKLLWGPPGTGKTTTLVATIMELLDSYPDIRLLVCAPSNAACDEIIEKVDRYNSPFVSGHLNRKFLRVNALSRHPIDCPSTVCKYCTEEFPGRTGFEFPTVSQLKQVTVVTLITAAKLYGIGVENFFDMLIVDEAAQASEPELQCAISCIKPDAGIILCGDHKQLGCVLHSTLCKQSELAISPLERASNAVPHAVTQLIDNYRSHGVIVDFVNLHYDGKLIARASNQELERIVLNQTSKPLVCGSSPPIHIAANRPVAFLHVTGQETRTADSPSWMNTQEVQVVKDIVRHLINDRKMLPQDIAVLAPYQRQTVAIRNALYVMLSEDHSVQLHDNYRPRAARGMDLVVSSVEAFQGQERRVVIISTVRSRELSKLQHDAKHNLGFVGQARRVNVALSRPQAMLFVVGNMELLSTDDVWWRAIAQAKSLGCLHAAAGAKLPKDRWVLPPVQKKRCPCCNGEDHGDDDDDDLPVDEGPAAAHRRDE